MTSTTSRSVSGAAPGAADHLPWPSLLVLGGATLVMVTTEMLPTAVLGPMSLGLGVPETRIAQLVSVWAGLVVLASFPLVRLTSRFDRRSVIGVGMLALAGSTALTAMSGSYATALGARLIGAAAVGLLWATVNAHVADLVSDRMLGRALAIVLGGATLGIVLGTPAARFLADLTGWRSAFAAAALLGIVVAGLVRALVPAAPVVGDRAGAADGSRARTSLRPMLVTTALVGLLLVGHYSAYTFITRLAEAPAALLPGRVSGLLLAFGVASAVGVVVAGRISAQRTAAALALLTALTALAVGALVLAGPYPAVGLAVVLFWGVVSGALPPLASTEIFRLAGPQHRTTAGAMIPVVFNGGIALGAALAAQLVSGRGVDALPVPAAAVVALAAAGLALAAARPAQAKRTAMPG